jgi:cell division septum initiation protein DivIVA
MITITAGHAQPEVGSAAELAPVRDFLLTSARQDCAEILHKAEDEAAVVLSAARKEADAIVAAARAEGVADAAAVAAADLTRAKRQAREVVLRTQRESFDTLRRQSQAAAKDLLGRADYGALHQQLECVARSRAGSLGSASEHPDGGFVVDGPGWRLDLSLPALADGALEALGPQVQGLWTP